jgi:X-Pro dipeptidyl-peptidase
VDNVSFSGSALAQAEWTTHRLMYVTPVLNQAVHISGAPRITIRASSSKPAVNLSVWLVSLPWSNAPKARITDTIITRGWADLQNYRSLTESAPLVPGKPYEMTFDLQPDDQVIPAGRQIGLMIFSSDRDFTLWPEPGTELTVDLDATSLSLPVVGGAEAFGRAVICSAHGELPGKEAMPEVALGLAQEQVEQIVSRSAREFTTETRRHGAIDRLSYDLPDDSIPKDTQ